MEQRMTLTYCQEIVRTSLVRGGASSSVEEEGKKTA